MLLALFTKDSAPFARFFLAFLAQKSYRFFMLLMLGQTFLAGYLFAMATPQWYLGLAFAVFAGNYHIMFIVIFKY